MGKKRHTRTKSFESEHQGPHDVCTGDVIQARPEHTRNVLACGIDTVSIQGNTPDQKIRSKARFEALATDGTTRHMRATTITEKTGQRKPKAQEM